MAQRGRKTNLKRLAQVAELEELRRRSRPEKPHLKTRGKVKKLPSKSRPDKPWLFTGKRGSTRGERNIQWVEEYLRVPEGKFAGDPLRLPEFMKEDFRAIYDNEAGTRRAIISRARKNAKTAEAAMLVLLHLCGPEGHAVPHAQIYSAAQSRDQAALIFNLAGKMLRLDSDLFEAVTIRETYKVLQCPHLDNVYRALSAEATTAFGLSPCLIVHDELGQVRGPRSSLYEALETATAAQANPLSVIISTQAPNEADLLSLLIDDAIAGHDPKTVLRFNFAGPEFDDPFTVEAIRAANPAVDIFMNKADVLSMAENARRMPARQAEFENLVLNRRVETNNPFVSSPLWRGCGGDVDDLADVDLYGGLDLSAVADLTALVLIGKIERAWHVMPTFWLPEEGLAEKAARDHVPYDTWKAQGFLETTPGNAISYEYVAAKLFGLFGRYRIRKIGFDRWGMKYLKPWLVKAGFTETLIAEVFVEVGQGTMSMTPALRDLEQAILQRELRHGNHPVLSMCAAQAIVEGTDSARKLSKARSIGRIDGMVALAMAFSVAPLTAPVIDINALIG